MSATPTNSYPSSGVTALCSQTYSFCADAVEFVPSEACVEDAHMLVCGNYQLSEDGSRLGRTLLSRFVPASCGDVEKPASVETIQIIESAAVLDLKW
jgi:hypothetical protein